MHESPPCQNLMLHEACRVNCLSRVRRLLASGAIVDAYDDNGLTPLGVARDAGAHSCIVELMKHGARRYHRDQVFDADTV
jgi:ankyrin repeat protein